MNTDINRVYRIIIGVGLGLAVGFLVCNRVVFAETPISCTTPGTGSVCAITPKVHKSLLDLPRMLAAAGEDPDGYIRMIMVDDEGRVLLSPTGTQMDIDGRIKINMNPCLAKMEAAMRAMEKFLVWDKVMPSQEGAVALLRDRSHFNMERNHNEHSAAFHQVTTLWETAKRDCWSRP